jgi:hypothetical protein
MIAEVQQASNVNRVDSASPSYLCRCWAVKAKVVEESHPCTPVPSHILDVDHPQAYDPVNEKQQPVP